MALGALLAVVGGSAFELVRSRHPGPVFADEFSGTRLDVDKWSSGYPWGCINQTTRDRECYVREALTVRDGLLVIEADRAEGGRLPYRSGMIVSARSFSRRYGYFELQARLPRARALAGHLALPKPTGK